MEELTLTVTVDEANKILFSLGTQPFNDVSALILKIQQQGAAQIAAATPDHSHDETEAKDDNAG